MRLDDMVFELFRLSPQSQARCLLQAAKKCLPIWERYEKQMKLGRLANDLIASFEKWVEGSLPSDDVKRSMERLYAILPKDLAKERDPHVGFAGYSILDVAIIGLDKDDPEYDPQAVSTICRDAVAYAAAAICGSGSKGLSLDADKLTPCESQFVNEWWESACSLYPILKSGH